MSRYGRSIFDILIIIELKNQSVNLINTSPFCTKVMSQVLSPFFFLLLLQLNFLFMFDNSFYLKY
jgi:hypothetical protein